MFDFDVDDAELRVRVRQADLDDLETRGSMGPDLVPLTGQAARLHEQRVRMLRARLATAVAEAARARSRAVRRLQAVRLKACH